MGILIQQIETEIFTICFFYYHTVIYSVTEMGAFICCRTSLIKRIVNYRSFFNRSVQIRVLNIKMNEILILFISLLNYFFILIGTFC